MSTTESTIGLKGRIVRLGMTALLMASSVTALQASHTYAQDGGLLSLSTIVPTETALYLETRLDSTSEQFQMLDDLMLRLGSEESIVDEIEDAANDSDVELDGAEIGIAILPSAFESAEEASAMFPDLGEISSVDDAENMTSEISRAADGQGVVIVILAMDPDALEAEALDEAGIDPPVETYLGVDIVSDVEEGGEPSYFARIDDFMVTGQSADDIKLFVDASLDGGESLASVDGFTEASSLLPQERLAYAFSNGPAIIDGIADQLPDPTFLDLIEHAVGAFVGYTGMTVAADPAGLRFESVNISIQPIPAESSEATDLTMASRMPADTVVFANGLELGQSMLMKSFGLLFVFALSAIETDSMEGDVEATPEPLTIDEMYESLALLFGFNLKTEFIDQMTGEYGFGIWGLESGNPADVSLALVSEVENPIILGDTLDSISFLVQAAGQGQFGVSSRELETGSINTVEIDTETMPVTVDYGVVDGEFILGIGNGADMVTSGPTESLADDPQYLAALSYLPSEFTSVQYVNVAALSAASAEMSEMMAEEGMGSDEDMMMAATEIPVDSIAAVGWTEDGNARVSAIVVVP